MAISVCSIACIPVFSDDLHVYASALTTEDWFYSLDNLADRLDANNFWYSNDNNSRTYKGALKKAKVTNCARYVTWALQDFGIIDKHTVFWIKKGGGIGGDASRIRKNDKLKILHPDRRASACKLEPGDICGWKDFQHTAVYAGTDSHGNRLWYSAGRDGGSKSGSRTYFKARKLKARKRASRYDGTISTVIRIKGLTKGRAHAVTEVKEKTGESANIEVGDISIIDGNNQDIRASVQSNSGLLAEADGNAEPDITPEVPAEPGTNGDTESPDNALVLDGSDIKGESDEEAPEEATEEIPDEQEDENTYESPETSDGGLVILDGVILAAAMTVVSRMRRRMN